MAVLARMSSCALAVVFGYRPGHCGFGFWQRSTQRETAGMASSSINRGLKAGLLKLLNHNIISNAWDKRYFAELSTF